MAIEVTVLQIDAGPVRFERREADLDLAGVGGLLVELPLRADVPGEHDPVRRLDGEHRTPRALGAVDASIVRSAADPRFEHRLGDLDVEQVVLARLDRIEVLREDLEGARPGDRDLDRELDRRRIVRAGGGDRLTRHRGFLLLVRTRPTP